MYKGITASLAAILAIALLAFSASAEAKSKKPAPLITISAQSPVAVGNKAIATATATCPGKTRAVGGGFLESTPIATPTASAQGSVYESLKVDQKSWRTSSQLFATGTASLNLTTYVNCRRHMPPTTTSTVTLPQANGPAIDQPVTATCAGALKAIAGGFSTPPPFTPTNGSTVVIDSLRSGTQSWTSQLLALGTASTLTSYAYCAKAKKSSTPQVRSPAPFNTGETATATAPCVGKKRQALAGGFSTPDAIATTTPPGSLSFYIPYESQRIGNAWRVSGMFAGGPRGSIVSTGYCV
ncbi:MAG: hypothetical protein QOD60_423 [Solirubrobacterales bacterium]|jgi:hypothetical protein|nr:hypothetical protein [Solirubrobacterales bacterium]